MLWEGQDIRYVMIQQNVLSTRVVFLFVGSSLWVLEGVTGSVVFPCTQIVRCLGKSDLLCLSRITTYMEKHDQEEECWAGGGLEWRVVAHMLPLLLQSNLVFSCYLCQWMVGKIETPRFMKLLGHRVKWSCKTHEVSIKYFSSIWHF